VPGQVALAARKVVCVHRTAQCWTANACCQPVPWVEPASDTIMTSKHGAADAGSSGDDDGSGVCGAWRARGLAARNRARAPARPRPGAGQGGLCRGQPA
jgi:hypothetical protein